MLSDVRKSLTLPPHGRRWIPSHHYFFLFIPKTEIEKTEGYLFFLISFISICLNAACFILLFLFYCAGYLHIDSPILIPFLKLFSFYSGLILIGVTTPLFVMLLAVNVPMKIYNPSWISASPPRGTLSLIYRILFGYITGSVISFFGWGFVAYLTKHASDHIKNLSMVIFVSGIPLIWVSGAAALCFAFSTSLWVAPLFRKLLELRRK